MIDRLRSTSAKMPGKGQAALLFANRPAPGLDDRIDEGLDPALAVVHHEDPVGQADLRRGQADAHLMPHGLGHVGDDPLDLGGDLADRRGHLSQHRVAVQPHRQQGHWAFLLWTASTSGIRLRVHLYFYHTGRAASLPEQRRQRGREAMRQVGGPLDDESPAPVARAGRAGRGRRVDRQIGDAAQRRRAFVGQRVRPAVLAGPGRDLAEAAEGRVAQLGPEAQLLLVEARRGPAPGRSGPRSARGAGSGRSRARRASPLPPPPRAAPRCARRPGSPARGASRRAR